MDIQIILIGFVILVMAWALERIVAKTQNLEKHILGLRSRLNNLEKRLASASQSPASVAQSYYSATRPSKARKAAPSPSRPSPTRTKPSPATSARTVVCPFCGAEYDISLDRCPKCHHINIEKYKVKKGGSSPGSDDFDI